MNTKRDPSEMTIKEFMEWYVSEYDDNALLPGDFEKTLNRLQGYALAKSGSPESFILDSAVTKMQTAHSFFAAVKRYTSWKYNP